MEYGTIERELHIDASPEVVFDVVSSPEHLRGWWPDEAEYPAVPGGSGRIAFGDPASGGQWVQFTVVDAVPHRLFSFRWTHDEGDRAERGNSFLVVFELEPDGTGTRLRMTESGFRERGWDEAKVAAQYAEHVAGWDLFLPRLPGYAALVAARAMSVAIDDDLWSAIGDPMRRRVVDLLLHDGGGTATSLSAHLPVTRQAIAKHLDVLHRVGLVHATSAGREKRYRVEPGQLARAAGQLADVGAAWDGRLRRIKRIAETIQRSNETSPHTPPTPPRSTR